MYIAPGPMTYKPQLESFLWDTDKQYSPRCDAAAEHGVPSGAILFAGISPKNEIKKNNTIPDDLYNESTDPTDIDGLIH